VYTVHTLHSGPVSSHLVYTVHTLHSGPVSSHLLKHLVSGVTL